MTERTLDQRALDWQIGVWDGISEIYPSEIDRRFAPVVDAVMTRAGLTVGERVLDLGTGTGAVAQQAATIVGPGGHVVAMDISPQMLAVGSCPLGRKRLRQCDAARGQGGSNTGRRRQLRCRPGLPEPDVCDRS